MDVGAALVANEQASKSMKPGDGALDDPALASEALAALDSGACDAAADAAHAQVKSVALGVVGLVRVQLFRPSLGSANASCDGSDSREHHAERRAVVDVRSRDLRRAEREPVAVRDDVVLAAETAAIGRVFPGEFAPLFAGTDEESRTAVFQSSFLAP